MEPKDGGLEGDLPFSNRRLNPVPGCMCKCIHIFKCYIQIDNIQSIMKIIGTMNMAMEIIISIISIPNTIICATPGLWL